MGIVQLAFYEERERRGGILQSAVSVIRGDVLDRRSEREFEQKVI